MAVKGGSLESFVAARAVHFEGVELVENHAYYDF
jgi:hypothetical protein